jgi:hypothetical protein
MKYWSIVHTSNSFFTTSHAPGLATRLLQRFETITTVKPASVPQPDNFRTDHSSFLEVHTISEDGVIAIKFRKTITGCEDDKYYNGHREAKKKMSNIIRDLYHEADVVSIENSSATRVTTIKESEVPPHLIRNYYAALAAKTHKPT